jgi:hypothetical protein
VRTRQRGRALGHVASAMHPTHLRSVGEHTPDGQLASVTQPTHSPDGLSHVVPPGHVTASLQAA